MGDLFKTKHYKVFLKQHLDEASSTTKGLKTALSQAMGCQMSYLSQVLHGEAQLSLEQAEKLAQFLHFNPQQTEYLFLMIQFARAGSESLRRHFSGKMDEILNQRTVVKNRIDVKEELSREDQSTYYSSWVYAAIHVLITIPEFRKPRDIAKKLNLSPEVARNAIEFLTRTGLAQEKGGELLPSKKRLHLGFDAAMINRHHTNWRLNTLQTLESKPHSASDLHYSSVVSISKKDAEKIREMLLQQIDQAKAVIKQSPEEELYGFHLDFYGI